MHGNGITNTSDPQAKSVPVEANKDDSEARPVPRPRVGMKSQLEVQERTNKVSSASDDILQGTDGEVVSAPVPRPRVQRITSEPTPNVPQNAPTVSSKPYSQQISADQVSGGKKKKRRPPPPPPGAKQPGQSNKPNKPSKPSKPNQSSQSIKDAESALSALQSAFLEAFGAQRVTRTDSFPRRKSKDRHPAPLPPEFRKERSASTTDIKSLSLPANYALQPNPHPKTSTHPPEGSRPAVAVRKKKKTVATPVDQKQSHSKNKQTEHKKSVSSASKDVAKREPRKKGIAPMPPKRIDKPPRNNVVAPKVVISASKDDLKHDKVVVRSINSELQEKKLVANVNVAPNQQVPTMTKLSLPAGKTPSDRTLPQTGESTSPKAPLKDSSTLDPLHAKPTSLGASKDPNPPKPEEDINNLIRSGIKNLRHSLHIDENPDNISVFEEPMDNSMGNLKSPSANNSNGNPTPRITPKGTPTVAPAVQKTVASKPLKLDQTKEKHSTKDTPPNDNLSGSKGLENSKAAKGVVMVEKDPTPKITPKVTPTAAPAVQESVPSKPPKPDKRKAKQSTKDTQSTKDSSTKDNMSKVLEDSKAVKGVVMVEKTASSSLSLPPKVKGQPITAHLFLLHHTFTGSYSSKSKQFVSKQKSPRRC